MIQERGSDCFNTATNLPTSPIAGSPAFTAKPRRLCALPLPRFTRTPGCCQLIQSSCKRRREPLTYVEPAPRYGYHPGDNGSRQTPYPTSTSVSPEPTRKEARNTTTPEIAFYFCLDLDSYLYSCGS